MRGLWSADATPHTRGRRKFLDMFGGTAIMIKGTIGTEVRWVPLTFLSKSKWAWCRWLGGAFGPTPPFDSQVEFGFSSSIR